MVSGGVDIKKHLHPSVYEECRCLYNELLMVNNVLAYDTAFFFRLRLTSAPASPTKPIPSSAIVLGSTCPLEKESQCTPGNISYTLIGWLRLS